MNGLKTEGKTHYTDLLDFQSHQWNVFFFITGLLLISGVYLMMFGNYRLEAIDDAWSLSYDWNFAHNEPFDPVFYLNKIPTLFGKTKALLYIPILDQIGWTRSNAHHVSLALILAGILSWYGILRHLNWKREDIALFAFLALMLEPFLGVANLTRPEPLCFLLLSISLLLFMKKCFFTSIFIACIASETHGLGAISFFYLLAWALVSFSKDDWRKAIPRGVVAVLLGIFYFFWINGTTVGEFFDAVRVGRQFSPSIFGTFSQYFIYRSYYRHVPELVLLLVSSVFFIRSKLFFEHRFLSVALVLTFIGSMLIRRGSSIYVIYYFPLFIMLLIVTAAHYRKRLLLAFLFVVLLLPQYSYLSWKQGGFHFEKYVAAISAAVPDDGTPIVGSSNNWFAFMKTGRFYDYYAAAKVAKRFSSIYVIEGYFPPYNSDNSVELGIAAIQEAYNRKTKIASFIHFGKTITVYRWERNL